MKAGNVHAKTLRLTLTLSQDVDLNGDVNVDSTFDLVRGPSDGLWILVEELRPMVKVEVDGGLNVHGHVNLNAWGQRRGQGQDRPQARTLLVRHLLSPVDPVGLDHRETMTEP